MVTKTEIITKGFEFTHADAKINTTGYLVEPAILIKPSQLLAKHKGA